MSRYTHDTYLHKLNRMWPEIWEEYKEKTRDTPISPKDWEIILKEQNKWLMGYQQHLDEMDSDEDDNRTDTTATIAQHRRVMVFLRSRVSDEVKDRGSARGISLFGHR
jgi:hypothetical protein